MRAPPSRHASLLFLLLVGLALPLPACGGDEDEATPGGTAAGAASATLGPPATSASTDQFGPGVTDSQIIIGAHCPLTGALAAMYATIPQATTAYFNYINDTEGGVCGRKIVYKVEDDNYDAAKALEVTRKLVEQDKVLAIVGALGAHPSAFDYLNEAGVPDLLLSTASHRFVSDPQTYPWTVLMIPDYTLEGTYFGQYISENLPGEKVAVLYENSYFGIEDLAGLKQGLDPTNQVVSEQPYDPVAVDIRSEVTNMKNSGADVAVLLTTPGYTVQAVKAAARLGWEPQFLASYVNSDDMMFQFASPELLEGMITFQALKMSAWAGDPAIARHYEIMSKYSGPAPSNFTVYAQALAELAVEVLSRACDNLTRQGLMDAIESIRAWRSDLLVEGVDVTVSDTDHTVLDTGRMLRVVVENGKGRFEYFGPIYYLRE